MTTVLATPITIASAISGNIPLTIGGAVATGVAQATDNLLEIYKSKNNWVGFVNDMKNDAIQNGNTLATENQQAQIIYVVEIKYRQKRDKT